MNSNPVRDFFPVLYQLASSTQISKFLYFLFPDSTTAHSQGLASNIADLKSPAVALAAGTGCAATFISGKQLFQLSRSESADFKGSFSWSMALLWYSLMCFGGFWYHSFYSIPLRQLFYKLDVLGTACCGMSMLVGISGVDDRNPANRTRLILLFASAAAFTLSDSGLATELLYLFWVAVAFLAGLWFVYNAAVTNNRKNGKRDKVEKVKKRKDCLLLKWTAVSVLGAAVSFIGLEVTIGFRSYFEPILGLFLGFFSDSMLRF